MHVAMEHAMAVNMRPDYFFSQIYLMFKVKWSVMCLNSDSATLISF